MRRSDQPVYEDCAPAFRRLASGVLGLTGGAGLVINTIYYVIASGLTANDFRVSATVGGAELDVTTDLTDSTMNTSLLCRTTASTSTYAEVWYNRTSNTVSDLLPAIIVDAGNYTDLRTHEQNGGASPYEKRTAGLWASRGVLAGPFVQIAGAVTDAAVTGAGWPAAFNGMFAIDTTNFQIYVRMGGVWKKTVALTYAVRHPRGPVTGPGTPGHQFSDITLTGADGVDVALHRTDARHVYAATGLIGITPPRQVVRPRPSAHGFINDTRNTEGRLIVLEGRLLGEQSATDMFTEFYAVAGAMLETLGLRRGVVEVDDRRRRLDAGAVKLHGELEPPVEVGPNILAYQAQLLAQDPRAYSQSESSSTGDALSSAPGGWTFPRTLPIRFNVSTAGTAAVNNLGNRPTPPVFRVYGMCVNPQILLTGTTSRIA
jgi:hypothetical protein